MHIATLRAGSGHSQHQPFSPFDVEKWSFRPAGLALTRFWNEVHLRAVLIEVGDLQSQAVFRSVQMHRDGLPSILNTSFQVLEPSLKALCGHFSVRDYGQTYISNMAQF
jgi:hypothetical protein